MEGRIGRNTIKDQEIIRKTEYGKKGIILPASRVRKAAEARKIQA